jgi:hypothetical protein
MPLNIFKNKKVLFFIGLILLSGLSLVYLLGKKRPAPASYDLVPTNTSTPTRQEQYYLRRVEFTNDKFEEIFWLNNMPYGQTKTETVNLFDKSRSIKVQKLKGTKNSTSPDGLFESTKQPNEILIKNLGTQEQFTLPFDARAIKVDFVWKSDSSGIFLFEKIAFPREVDYVYFWSLTNKVRVPLADTFPIPTRLNFSVSPEISSTDDLMFLDNAGGIWILSKTPPKNPDYYGEH